ncbi:MAG: hypothetical protein KIT84_31045 [Labilithrix sp.]|nr:hypothetical protein [Labilithrix sp.]MCW5815506.1 hypothetical protein [Labilithrix sp.]
MFFWLAAAASPDAPTQAGQAAPTGSEIRYAARPALPRAAKACSPRVPVCVHFAPRDAPAAPAALAAFERTWPVLTGALALPRPELDPMTLAHDVFLVDGENETLLEARDVRSNVDRGRGFTLLDRRMRAGCNLDAAAATAVARASLLGVAPATEEPTARAQARYFAQLAVPCAVAYDADAFATFQSQPERPFADAGADARFADGAAAFWSRVDWAYGRTPGAIPRATWALHPTTTPVGARRWMNEPDTFDVLRLSFKNALSTGSTVNDLWLDFGVARAFLGAADDGLHQPELRTLGEAGRVPVAWDIPWPNEPRRLAPRVPVAPTGAAYLVVRRAGAKPGARLRAEIEWEEHALFRWAFVKLDERGRELGRVVIPTQERATEAQMTLVDLDAVDRVMLVGVNVGDPAYAFDPDDGPLEPHGWLVTIAEER